MNSLLRFLCLLSAVIMLSACARLPSIQPTLQPLEVGDLAAEGTDGVADVWRRGDWWQEFADPQLNELIDQALHANPDLQAARARFERAAAIADASAATLWPRIDLNGSVTRTRFSKQGEIPPPFAGSISNVNDTALQGLWELDFFGRNRQALQAALGSARSTAAEQQSARVLLASNVARRYFDLARQLRQRTLLQEHIEDLRELHALIQRRYDAGIDPRDDLDEARARLEEGVRELAVIDGEVALTRHALAAMLGKAPDALQTLEARAPAARTFSLPRHLPADLLGHRADVAASRWRVAAAQHQMAATRAGFYPNIDLRVFTGYSSISTLDHWLEAGSRQSGIGVAFSLPIFNAGQLRAEYRARNAETELAIAEYNATLLGALREVADELSSLHSSELQLQHQQTALDRSHAARKLSKRRYASGIGDRLEVLGTETAVYTRERQLIELQAHHLDTRIHLIRALGGGYTQDANLASPRHAPPAARPANDARTQTHSLRAEHR